MSHASAITSAKPHTFEITQRFRSTSKTFNRLGRPLGVHDLTNVDFCRVARQFDAAALATVAFDETSARQIMNDLDQMVARDVLTIGDRNVHHPVVMEGEIHQNAEPVVAVVGELHEG